MTAEQQEMLLCSQLLGDFDAPWLGKEITYPLYPHLIDPGKTLISLGADNTLYRGYSKNSPDGESPFVADGMPVTKKKYSFESVYDH